MTNTLTGFLSDARLRNQWVEYGYMEAYLRRGNRHFNQERANVLDIANVNITDPEQRGYGTFKSFIKLVKASAPSAGFGYLYVENVGNVRLAEHLKKNGWSRAPSNPGVDLIEPPSFYLKL